MAQGQKYRTPKISRHRKTRERRIVNNNTALIVLEFRSYIKQLRHFTSPTTVNGVPVGRTRSILLTPSIFKGKSLLNKLELTAYWCYFRCNSKGIIKYHKYHIPWDFGDSLRFHVQGILLTLQTLHFQLLIPNLKHLGLQPHIHD